VFLVAKGNGKGTFYYLNGDRYEGDWVDDVEHGEGVIYYHNGTMRKEIGSMVRRLIM